MKFFTQFFAGSQQTPQTSELLENLSPLETDEYTLRTYIPGDEVELSALFNSTHSDLAGFVPRTAAYWKWSCLNRPNVEAKGIAVVARKTEVAGYAVVGKTGDIWELSYNPKEDAKEIVRQLLSWATNYAQEVGGDSVVLNEYAKDQVIREVCQELEFVEAPSEQVFASVLDLQQLILSILQSKKGAFEVEGAFRFNLRNCPSWCKNSIVLRRGKNGFSLAEENALKEDFSMDVDMQTLVEIIFGTKTPTEALFASEVHARPFWKIRKCLSLLSLLKTDLPWVVPKADIG